MKRKLVAGVLVAAVAWRIGASAQRLTREISRFDPAAIRLALTATQDERIRFELIRRELEKGLEPGLEYDLYASLRDRVPADAVIWFVTPERTDKTKRGFSHLKVLLYPRRLFFARSIPPNWKEILDLDERFHLVEYDTPPSGMLDASFELLDSGQDYHLWHFRGEGQ